MDKKEVLRAISWCAAAAVIMTAIGNFVCPPIGSVAASFCSSAYLAQSSDAGKKAETEETVKSAVPEPVSDITSSTSTTAEPASQSSVSVPVSEENVKASEELSTPKQQESESEPPKTQDAEAVKSAEVQPASENQPSEKKEETSASEIEDRVILYAELPKPYEQTPQPSADVSESPKAAESSASEVEPPVKATESSPAETPKSDSSASPADSPGTAEVPKESPPEPYAKKELSPDDISELEKSLKDGEVREVGEGLAAYKVKKGDTFSQICKKVFGTSASWKEQAEKSNIDPRKIRPGKVLIFKKE